MRLYPGWKVKSACSAGPCAVAVAGPDRPPVHGDPLEGRNLKHRHLKPILRRVAEKLYPTKGADAETMTLRCQIQSS